MTGGDPRATGVYYDVEYNHASTRRAPRVHRPRPAPMSSMTRPTTSTRRGSTPARAFPVLQSDPSKIMQMTGTPQTLMNPATFPVDLKSCKPI